MLSGAIISDLSGLARDIDIDFDSGSFDAEISSLAGLGEGFFNGTAQEFTECLRADPLIEEIGSNIFGIREYEAIAFAAVEYPLGQCGDGDGGVSFLSEFGGCVDEIDATAARGGVTAATMLTGLGSFQRKRDWSLDESGGGRNGVFAFVLGFLNESFHPFCDQVVVGGGGGFEATALGQGEGDAGKLIEAFHAAHGEGFFGELAPEFGEFPGDVFGAVDAFDVGLGVEKAARHGGKHFIGGPGDQKAAADEEDGGGENGAAIFEGEEAGSGVGGGFGVGNELGEDGEEIAVFRFPDAEPLGDVVLILDGVWVFHQPH